MVGILKQIITENNIGINFVTTLLTITCLLIQVKIANKIDNNTNQNDKVNNAEVFIKMMVGSGAVGLLTVGLLCLLWNLQ